MIELILYLEVLDGGWCELGGGACVYFFGVDGFEVFGMVKFEVKECGGEGVLQFGGGACAFIFILWGDGKVWYMVNEGGNGVAYV